MLVMTVGVLVAVGFAPGEVRGQEATPEKIGNEDDLMEILENLTPQELEVLVASAAQRRLQVERVHVVGEISQNILYEEDAVKKAVDILNKNPSTKPTQQDNIERICEAFAVVDDRFAGPYELYKKGKFSEAAGGLKKNLNPEEATYLSAAMYYIFADSMLRSGKDWEGVEAFTDILVNLPDRISFASSSSLRAARAYEAMNRNLYAMDMYVYCLKNYSLTMDKEEISAIMEKVEKLQGIYKDPLNTAADMMSEVKERLDRKDVGKGTQKRQGEVLALLEDLIRTAEEKERLEKNQKRKQQQRQRKGGQKPKGQAGKQGQKQGKPGMTRNPTVGAKVSVLVPGPVTRPNKLAQKHGGSDSGKWSDLPPRQREKVRSLMRQRLAERRGDLVRQYHRKLAESE